MNDNGGIWVADSLEQADWKARELEEDYKEDCRVISLESVHE